MAKDRTISTVDPEARHGHKTRTHKRDGYKAHVAVEPETGLVTGAVLTAANTPDADNIADLVADQPPGAEIVADSAYASGAALETFDDLGHTRVVKPIVRKPHIKGGYHRDDFDIDTGGRTVTCPAGHTTRIRPGGTAPFSKRCNGCPLRARCTTSKCGRTIAVDKHHDRRAANKARWAKEEAQDTYRNLRPSVERTIAWAHSPQSQTRPTPGTSPQPAMARHQNSSHQPTTPHQPRTHPHHHRLGTQPHLNHQTTGNPKTGATPPRQPAPPPPTGSLPPTHTSQQHIPGLKQHPFRRIAQHPPSHPTRPPRRQGTLQPTRSGVVSATDLGGPMCMSQGQSLRRNLGRS